MKKQTDINAAIYQTLNVLNKVQRADAPPFFYIRLQARMAALAEGHLEPRPWWVLSPVQLMASLAVLLMLNVATYLLPASGNSVAGSRSAEQTYQLYNPDQPQPS